MNNPMAYSIRFIPKDIAQRMKEGMPREVPQLQFCLFVASGNGSPGCMAVYRWMFRVMHYSSPTG